MSSALRLRKSSAVVLAVTSLLGLVAFTWPLFVDPVGSENAAHSGDAPWVFLALLPLLFAVIVAELAEGDLDAKAVALLGVLAACGAALRLPGGVTGWHERRAAITEPFGRHGRRRVQPGDVQPRTRGRGRFEAIDKGASVGQHHRLILRDVAGGVIEQRCRSGPSTAFRHLLKPGVAYGGLEHHDA